MNAFWCERRARCVLVAIVVTAAGNVTAAEAPATPEAVAEATRLAVQHAYRVEVAEGEHQDPVVFTDIAPYTTDEEPVKLPADQSLD